MAAALASCGGSDGDSGNTPAPQPPIVQAPFKMEMLAGRTEVDFNTCINSNPIMSGRFNHLQRLAAQSNGLYLIDSSENCSDNDSAIQPGGIFREKYIGPSILLIENNLLFIKYRFWAVQEILQPISPIFINSFYREDGSSAFRFLALSHGAAPSETGFEVDEPTVTRYTNDRIWGKFALGLFKQPSRILNLDAPTHLVAGSPGQPPGYADGKGQAEIGRAHV